MSVGAPRSASDWSNEMTRLWVVVKFRLDWSSLRRRRAKAERSPVWPLQEAARRAVQVSKMWRLFLPPRRAWIQRADVPLRRLQTLRPRWSILTTTRLWSTRPRPIKKRFGLRGPTPEQLAAHQAEVHAWNAAYRKASKMQKQTLEKENAEWRRRHGAS